MNKAQQYMIKNREFSNASGDLDDLTATLSTKKASKVALEGNIATTREKIAEWEKEIELVPKGRTDSFAIKMHIRGYIRDAKRRISDWETMIENIIEDIDILNVSIEAYQDSPVHEQELLVADTLSQLSDTETDLTNLATDLENTVLDSATKLEAQKKRYKIIGIVGLVLIGGYVMLVKK